MKTLYPVTSVDITGSLAKKVIEPEDVAKEALEAVVNVGRNVFSEVVLTPTLLSSIVIPPFTVQLL